MHISVQEWRSTARENPSRRDPLVEMLRASFERHTATIPLDDPVAIVQVLQERCHPDILHTVQQSLEEVLAHRAEPVTTAHRQVTG